jgi:hypothetical protein
LEHFKKTNNTIITGTKYPTMPMYFPLTYTMLDATQDDAPLRYNFDEIEDVVWKDAADIMEPVRQARQALRKQVQNRFIDDVEGTDTEIKYWVALALHPAFNHIEFTSEANVPQEKKQWVLMQVRRRWAAEFKPPAPPTMAATGGGGGGGSGGGTAAVVGGAGQPRMKKRKTNSLNSLMQMTKALEPAEQGSSSTAFTPEDELEKYLGLPQETLCDGFDLLVWWKQRESLYPNLSKMVKVIMACPISSAGAERVFSAAGRMHQDEQKSRGGLSLKHMLFVAFNY